MSVDIRKFVDINIKQHVSSNVSGTRETIVLYTAEGDDNTPIDVTEQNYLTACEGMTTTLSYLSVYFNNGGNKARVIGNTTIANLTAAMIKALPNEYICIAYAAESTNVGTVFEKICTIATSLNADSDIYGVNRKILLTRTSTLPTSSSSQIPYLAVKYSTVMAAEMTIAAYLSQINVYNTDSIHDYMYTTEDLTAEELSTDNYEACISNNVNVDIFLAGATRNCGGNLNDGADIVNTYSLIILHQTLTSRLLDLLSQKIKGSSGLGKIYAVICQELAAYLTSGFLTTDKIWTDNDLIVSYNNENYTVVEKGTALTDGYVVKILPFTSLTEADKTAHKTPPIYIVLSTQYGIRTITINGEVI